MTSKFFQGLALGILGTVVAAIAAWLFIVYTGAYNVAASDQHADAVRWSFNTTMRRSISSRADEMEMPGNLSEELVSDGAGHYAESCVHCHGAPGREQADWSKGMRPEPPRLTEAASEWTPQEIAWIVTHGIKMTAMPAFGEHHSPEEIVAIAAFVSELPGLTAEDYQRLTEGASDHQAEEATSGGEQAASVNAAEKSASE